MRFSHLLAVAFAVGAAGWVLSGNFGDEVPAAENGAAIEEPVIEAPEPTRVRVATSNAQAYALELTLTGQTAAHRVVALTAQTHGRIESVEVREGEFVEEGMEIARLALDDRMERLERARSSVRQYEIEYEASSELAESGWRTEAAAAAAHANLDRARAELASIRLDIERTRIVAPISGILEELDIEVGKVVFTGAGNTLGEVVDLDPITVVAFVSETQVERLETGVDGTVRLATGEVVTGNLRFIGSMADPQTRTYRVELEFPNPGHAIRAGMTTLVKIPLASIPSHFISPSVLSLDDDGALGVKIVDESATVRFLPVTIIAGEAKGYHVAGLPETVTLITVGQEYASDGETVIPVRVEGSAFSETS